MKTSPVAKTVSLTAVAAAVAAGAAHSASSVTESSTLASESTDAPVRYGTTEVNGLEIFSRESGDPAKPTIVLLHGFPTSSHMYRDVVAQLGTDYHVVAPDYPGFGDSSYPDRDDFEYTFDNLADVMDAFLEARGLDRYTLMIQDYGAPIGFRIALKHPERVEGIVSMNGNAYTEGLGKDGWGPVMDYWQERTPEIEQTIIKNVFSLEGLEWQYTHGTREPDAILPDNWNLDFMKLSRPGQHQVQLELFYDYQNNVTAYPEWQAYLRENQPPMLVIWGENDAFFTPPGARASLRDVPDAELHLLNTGHFALEEEGPRIIGEVREFLGRVHE